LWDNIEKNWDFVWIFYALETLWRSILKKKTTPKKKKKKKKITKKKKKKKRKKFFCSIFLSVFLFSISKKSISPSYRISMTQD
jgi:hypothetical protein